MRVHQAVKQSSAHLLIFTLLFSTICFANEPKRLQPVKAGDYIPLLADGAVFWGKGELFDEDLWAFPFNPDVLQDAELEAELFWNDFGADLKLAVEFSSGPEKSADAVNTQSEVLRFSVSNRSPVFLKVSLVEHVNVKQPAQNKQVAISYTLRCLVRRRRPLPTQSFDLSKLPTLTLGEISDQQTSISPGDKQWWEVTLSEQLKAVAKNKRPAIGPFDATLFVALEPLRDGEHSPDDFQRYELQLHESVSGEQPRLRKTSLVSINRRPECFLSLEALSKLEGDGHRFLVRVSLKEGAAGTYRLRGALLYPNQKTPQGLIWMGDRHLFQIKSKRPWKQKLVGSKYWGTEVVEIPVWNPGELIISATLRQALPDEFPLKEALRLSHDAHPPKMGEALAAENALQWRVPVSSQGPVTVRLHAVDRLGRPPVAPPHDRGDILHLMYEGGDISYRLETLFLPDWKVVYKANLDEQRSDHTLNLFPTQGQGIEAGHEWTFSPSQPGPYAVTISSPHENGWFDLEVFHQGEAVRFVTRASVNPQERGGAYQRTCTFTAEAGEKYIALVSLNTRPLSAVSYKLAATPLKGENTQTGGIENTLVEGRAVPFSKTSQYSIPVHGPARALIQLSHANASTPLDVEILESGGRLDVTRTHYGIVDQLAVDLPETRAYSLTIRPLTTPPTDSAIAYVLQRKGLDKAGKPAVTDGGNDHFSRAEWVTLPTEDGQVHLLGQVNPNTDPADCWRLEWKGSPGRLRVKFEAIRNANQLIAYSATGEVVRSFSPGDHEISIGGSGETAVTYLMVVDTRTPGVHQPVHYTIVIQPNHREIEAIQIESDVDFRRK